MKTTIIKIATHLSFIGKLTQGTPLVPVSSIGLDISVKNISKHRQEFITDSNKFATLTSKVGAFLCTWRSLSSLATDLMKNINDIQMALKRSRCGLGEMFIPEGERSSIMLTKLALHGESMTMVYCTGYGK